MDSTGCSRNLLLAIDEFERVHRDDDRFDDVVSKLSDARSDVVALVPSAKHDPGESPGKRDAREVAEEARKRRSDRDDD